MAAYCHTEVDRYPTDICPYNEAHRPHSLKLYENHVVSCKDKHFPGVVEYLCRYNIAHIFVDLSKREYHEPRCEAHPMRLQWKSQYSVAEFGKAARQPQYTACPYFQYHFVLLLDDEQANRANMDTHKLNCPRKSKPLAKDNLDPHAHDPLVPFAPSGHLSCIANPEIEASMTARLTQERVILHFKEIPFCVRSSVISRTQLPDKHIYVDSLVNSSSTQFPGILKHTEVRDHMTTLVAKLAPDPVDQPSITAFWGFYGGMEKAVTKMAISYQSASTLDRVWLVVHPGEMTGFGGCVNKGELGLFVIPHTDLLGVQSTLETLKERLEYLSRRISEEKTENEKKEVQLQEYSRQLNSDISQQLVRETHLKQEIEHLSLQLSQSSQQFHSHLLKIQTSTMNDFEEHARQHQAELKAVQQEAEVRVQQALVECSARVTAGNNEIASERNQRMLLANENEYFQKKNVELENWLKEAERRHLAAEAEIHSLRMGSSELERRVVELEKEKEAITRGLNSRTGRQSRAKAPPHPAPHALPLCLDCNEHERNTILLPCGHLCFCNLCVSSRKIPLGTSLKYMLSGDTTCPVCRSKFTKVNQAYFG